MRAVVGIITMLVWFSVTYVWIINSLGVSLTTVA